MRLSKGRLSIEKRLIFPWLRLSPFSKARLSAYLLLLRFYMQWFFASLDLFQENLNSTKGKSPSPIKSPCEGLVKSRVFDCIRSSERRRPFSRTRSPISKPQSRGSSSSGPFLLAAQEAHSEHSRVWGNWKRYRDTCMPSIAKQQQPVHAVIFILQNGVELLQEWFSHPDVYEKLWEADCASKREQTFRESVQWVYRHCQCGPQSQCSQSHRHQSSAGRHPALLVTKDIPSA